MSIFGRIGNLAKGVIKTTVSPRKDLDECELEAELARKPLRNREALEAELAKLREEPEKAAAAPKGPQRDEHGNIKKTL